MCCGEPGGEEPRLYAAASLTTVSDELVAARSPDAVTLVLGATSLVARQLQEGAPPGCFLGADLLWADELESAGLVEPGTRVDLLANRLVVIVPAGSSLAVERLDELGKSGVSRLALADPDSVPGGRYAAAALRHVDAWTSLESRVVACSDVHAVTALVAAGEVDAGIVYATEVRGADVRVVHEIDPGSHPPIIYPLLLVKGASPRARELWSWLQSDAAAALLRDAGFVLLRD
jgi:molybdate transport system substrate-binding protein